MGSSSICARLGCIAALGAALLACTAEAPRAVDAIDLGGPVVESSLAARAPSSFLPGDVLLSWERAANRPGGDDAAFGVLRDVADVWRMEIEERPRAALTVSLRRAGEELSLPYPERPGAVRVRPFLPPKVLRAYEAARSLVEDGELETGVAALQALASSEGTVPELSAWLLFRAAELVRRGGDSNAAAELLARAEETLRTGEHGGGLLPLVLDARGGALLAAGRLDEAAAVYEEALSLRRRAEAGGLELAHALTNLGLVRCQLGEKGEGLVLLEQALELRRKEAPGSLEEAASLNNLGNYEPDLDLQEEHHLAALAIRRRRAPDSAEVAASLNNLGNLAWHLGDYGSAEARLEEALAIFERLEPRSRFVAGTLGNLALVAADRGDLEGAEVRIRQTLEILHDLEPDGLFYQRSLSVLGNVLRRRGDLEAAEGYYRQVLERAERAAPKSEDVAIALLNLGAIESERPDLAAARDLVTRALELYEQIAPGSVGTAIAHNNLGTVLRASGRLEEARRSFEEAHAIWERAAPGSLRSASALLNLGNLDLELGRLNDAEGQLHEALAVVERLAPEGTWMAMAARDLGRLRRRQGRAEEALRWYRRAIVTVEAQQGRLGGDTTSRGRFRSSYLDIYDETVDLLLELEREVEAFDVHERSRAQGMLAMLAERDLVLDADLPAELRRERRRLRLEYDRLQERLATLSPETDAIEVESVLGELRRTRLRQREADAEARRLSPRLQQLQYPEPLGLAGLSRELPPGTVVLSFGVGDELTRLFVLDAAGALDVHTMPIGDEELRELVRRFLDLLTAGRSTPLATEAMHELGRELYRRLLAPAESVLLTGAQLLFIPDGPLHTLPFAALVLGEGGGSGNRYLLELAPLDVAPSVSTAVELGRRAGSAAIERDIAELPLVVFGDPRLAGGESSAAARRRLAGRGLAEGGSLPASRDEVGAIAELFGGRAEVYLGSRATERRAKSVGHGSGSVPPRPVVLHFATHGFVDRRLPLDSALVLSPGGGENGLLQAWEVFEQVRLDARLVVLSACETAAGSELAGEGLVGLTGAFHYAGSSAVLASLWSVPDVSTAALMARFYRHLLAGASRAEALRAAQLELRAGPVEAPAPGGLLSALRRRLAGRGHSAIDATHPYHWAAFQLYGAAR